MNGTRWPAVEFYLQQQRAAALAAAPDYAITIVFD
jgi:hypothetical protein